MSDKARIAVIGGGLMGHGIAQVFALAGHRVAVCEPADAVRNTVVERIRTNLRDLGQDVGAAGRVECHASIAATVHGADVVFEAGPENLDVKRRMFAEMEAAASPSAILASNTSVIPITRITSELERPERSLGTHWWNPPFLVPLVEVIRSAATSDEAVEAMTQLLQDCGKTPVTVEKDVPGFVGNRLQHALWREAIALVQNGVCSAETVDTVVKACFGRRLAVLGPLENADLVGTDLTLAIHETVLPDIDVTPGALPYLKELVASGRLGMKSGEGFRKWTPEQQAEVRRRVLSHLKALQEQGI